MPRFSLGIGDTEKHEELATLKDEDFIDPENPTKPNPDTTIINESDNPEVPDTVLSVGSEGPSEAKKAEERGAVERALTKLKTDGNISQTSLESEFDLLAGAHLLPLNCYTPYKSKVHYAETVKRLETRLKALS